MMSTAEPNTNQVIEVDNTGASSAASFGEGAMIAGVPIGVKAKTSKADVYLNGRFMGRHVNALELVMRLREQRRGGRLPAETTIAFLEKINEVHVFTDSGRVLRPLIVIENGVPRLTKDDLKKLRDGELDWNGLLESGKMEYLDAEEEESALIALNPEDVTPKHTHLEIDALSILGLPATLVPFANYSRGDRVNYGTSKGVKQALGIYVTNYAKRFDTYSNILHYPQTPIVQSKTTDSFGMDSHPAGQNFVVALIPWGGYNMEDAVVINRGTIERGLGRSTFYRPYSSGEKRYPGGQEDKLEIPNKEVIGYRTEDSYKYLEDDGIIALESTVESEDVLIGKTSPPRFLGAVDVFRRGIENRRESSENVRHGERGVVDQVIVTEDKEGNRKVKVRLRDDRTPELGDKFSSRHGQKGVIGLIVPEEDMPFSESGLVPDMMANPHGIPSRMTVSQLMEFLSGKAGSLKGELVDGTAFARKVEFEGSESAETGHVEDPLEDMRSELKEAGFRPDGREVFYDGVTGKKFEAEIFVGVIYYHKLRHMVQNKIHARARGPVQILTRQPTEGRSKKGGLRMGEMEKDCLVAHGAALLLKERFDSDKTTIPVCENCGIVAFYDKATDRSFCPICTERTSIETVEISYAFHILMQELMSIGILPKLVLSDLV